MLLLGSVFTFVIGKDLRVCFFLIDGFCLIVVGNGRVLFFMMIVFSAKERNRTLVWYYFPELTIFKGVKKASTICRGFHYFGVIVPILSYLTSRVLICNQR